MKNRNKYMKQIYECLTDLELAEHIAVTKDNKVKVCYDTARQAFDCEDCKFYDGEKCNIEEIIDWLEQEEE